ncbi:MAG: zinc-binding dehydrogenase, partial [Elusimicrobia bacterium]|nr:zinc-binding dehydrogenase [Elusimicrobiota bacterium]
LAAALKAGAGEAFSALDGELAAAVRAACGGRGADCVFEAVGTEATWRQSVEMARRGGRVCLFGGCAPGTTVPIDAHRLHYEQLELRGVFHHAPLYFKQALDLLCAGRVPTSLLVGRSIRLEDVPAFFERFQAGSAPKAAVLP